MIADELEIVILRKDSSFAAAGTVFETKYQLAGYAIPHGGLNQIAGGQQLAVDGAQYQKTMH